MKYKIPRGTPCYGSTKGHYNFYYPNFTYNYETTMALEATLMPWVCFDDPRAVKIVSPENYMPLQIVWIKTLGTPIGR